GAGKDDFRTKNTRATLIQTAPNGTYWWRVRAIARTGTPSAWSAARSFKKNWGTTTTLLSPTGGATIVYPTTPLTLKWAPLPGAARYEVEVNPSSDFAGGSKVCCTGTTTNTSLAPTMVLGDNSYYLRVRAIDMDGHAGVWNCYGTAPNPCLNLTPFVKTFDNVPPTTAPSIKGLRMRDNVNDPGQDTDSSTAGYQTQIPILSWNPVLGASSYEVDVTPYNGSGCLWSATKLQHHFN